MQTASQPVHWPHLYQVHEIKRERVMESMDFGEFMWWCGFFICIGASMAFGGLFGIAFYDFIKGVIRGKA